MVFVVYGLFVFNFIIVITRISDVSTEDSQESKKKLENVRVPPENNFDYWEIDHNEASAIYYEPADLYNAKPFELSKSFFIRNPRADGSSIYSRHKTHSSTNKEKRNSSAKKTDTSELCVNHTVLDEGTNLLLDVNLATSTSLRSSDSKEVTTEFYAIDDIQSTEQKLTECIDLHLFKNKDVIENWESFLSESKLQMFSKLDQQDIDKEILKKCKHLEDIIESNLDLLKRSMPRRIKDSSAESTTTPKLSIRTNKLLTKEAKYISNIDDSISIQTENPLDDLLTNSSIFTSRYKMVENPSMTTNFSGINKHPIPFNNKLPATSLNELRNINEDNPYRRSNTLDAQPKRNRGIEDTLKESDIKIPKILTRELINGSVISDINGTETLPNDDFINPDNTENLSVQTIIDKTNSTIRANKLNTPSIIEEQFNEKTTLAAPASKLNVTIFANEPTTSSADFSHSSNLTIAPTENILAKEIFVSRENNVSESFLNPDKWLTESNSTDDEYNTVFAIAKQVYETTTDHYIIRANQDDNQSSTPPDGATSLNGTLFFDFNGELVPTHFIQNSKGSINIAIDGKSFCDNVRENYQSVILLAICKSNYETSNTNLS